MCSVCSKIQMLCERTLLTQLKSNVDIEDTFLWNRYSILNYHLLMTACGRDWVLVLGFYRPQRIHADKNECTSCRWTLLDSEIHKSQLSEWETWLSLFQMVWNYCFWCERGSWCPLFLKWENVSVTVKHFSSEHVFPAFLTAFSNALILLPDNLSSSLAVIYILGFFSSYADVHSCTFYLMPKYQPSLHNHVAKTL